MKTRYAAILNLIEDEKSLLPLTNRRPVAALPFACRYRLIDFPFSTLAEGEATSAALFISGTGRSLYDHVRSGATWGLDNYAGGGVFTYSQQKLKSEQADEGRFDDYYYIDHEKYLEKSRSTYTIVTGSNIVANIQVEPVRQSFEEDDDDITVVYKSIDKSDVKPNGEYLIYSFDDEGKLLKVYDQTDSSIESDQISFGLDFLLTKTDELLAYLPELEKRDLTISVKNILNTAIELGDVRIGGFEYTGYMKLINDIKSYYDANMDMLEDENFYGLFNDESPIITKSMNSVPTYYGDESKIDNSLFASGCQIYGEVEESLIFRKAVIGKNAKVSHSIILQESQIAEDAELSYVILDKRVQVEKGAKLVGTADKPIVVPKEARVLSSGEIVEG